MPLITRTEQLALDVQQGGEPFVKLPTKPGIIFNTLDVQQGGEPYWALEDILPSSGSMQYNLNIRKLGFTGLG